MPKVYSRHDPRAPAEAVYVGRPTKFGNPFTHLAGIPGTVQVASADEAVARYERFLDSAIGAEIVTRAKIDLRGRDLICCGRPPCHAYTLLRIANED